MTSDLKKVLIIDDDPLVTFLTVEYIKSLKSVELFEVVRNGQEALVYLSKNSKPDLIILDISMPVLSGFEFLEIYKESLHTEKEPKIVVMSASWREEVRLKALEMGAVDYVLKPINRDKMDKLIRKHFPENT